MLIGNKYSDVGSVMNIPDIAVLSAQNSLHFRYHFYKLDCHVREGCKEYQSLPHSAEVKNDGAIPQLPHTSS